VAAVGEKVILGSGTHGIHQTPAKLALEKPHDAAYLLQRESARAQLADDGDFGKIVEAIQPPVTLADRNYQATFIPPLQLAQADAGQTGNVAGCEGRRQESKIPKQKFR
jgi:hypothetical protein